MLSLISRGGMGMDKVGPHFSRGNGVFGMLPFKYPEESWRYERWAGERERAAANRDCKLYFLGLTPSLSSALLEADPFYTLSMVPPATCLNAATTSGSNCFPALATTSSSAFQGGMPFR